MKSKIKFVCPDCGGQLQWWDEMIYEEQRKINKKGKLSKRKTINSTFNGAGASGIRCLSCNHIANCLDNGSNDDLCNFNNKTKIIEIIKEVDERNYEND